MAFRGSSILHGCRLDTASLGCSQRPDIEYCLNPADAGQIQRAPALGRGEAGLVRRCMSLEDAASWSRDRPVLLVLDWRGGTDTTRWFQRFENQEVPLYESALRARGAIAAWCCRSDVRRRGWRDGLSGIGFPSRGQRTYYMIESGNVVTWSTVRKNEFPASLQGDDAQAREPLVRDWDIRMEKRFITILTALIVSSERHRCHGVSSGSSTSSQGSDLRKACCGRG